LAALITPHKIPVVPRSVLDTYELVGQVMERCDRAKVSCVVYDCTADTDVPTYSASLYDQCDQGVGVVRGSGARLDPGIAMLRATTEALQARLNFIAGSRDDIFRSAFRRFRVDWATTVSRIEADMALAPAATQRPAMAATTFEDDIRAVISRLERADLHHVAVVDLTPDGCPIHVVRVVVPGLEGYMHHSYRPGRRAVSFATEVATSCA
jgi:YcaO-like protein with predicted kinase domain